ncbi:DNA-binding transcriptional regulator, MarR family [Pseudarcicella hirudinis]|uniref:DNA-binding transcriptional regulator, MarR family n=1 Tax=Pseudarcicella hirudinis TaxID=1079859 RepID=A0A1I5MNE1_9BACT|nr:MarR family transcriptional regulator [Pseudarcicella hirudinis]SFP10451.1 DNA-binding transcriptional regulator, MarR family [Pseudarcicella hirudinis]
MNSSDQKAYFFKIDTTIKKIRYALQKALDEANLDITVDQWVLIDHIFRNPGISQNDLGEMTVKDNPTVTRIIDLLVKKGLSERKMSESDRRRFDVFLTETGKEVYHKAHPIVVHVRRKSWSGLNDEDYFIFTRILDTIYKNITT